MRKRGNSDGGDGDKDRVFGSTYWVNFARRLWVASATPSDDENTTIVCLSNPKANNGRHAQSHALRLRFLNSPDDYLLQIDIRTQALADVPELREKLPLKERILLALRGRAMSASQLAEELGTELDDVKPRLSDMKRTGKLVNLPDHTWGLVARVS